MFGSNKKADGTEINANGKTPVLVGEKVEGNVFVEAKWYNDEHKSFVISFKQTNGAIFTHRFNRPNPESASFEKSLEYLNTQMLHIATKVMSEQEYLAAVAGSSDFETFVTKLIAGVFSKMVGKTFNLKITYKYETGDDGKVYSLPQLPLFPNFIEPGDTKECTFSTNPSYDFYVRKTNTTSASEANGLAAPATPTATGDDIF